MITVVRVISNPLKHLGTTSLLQRKLLSPMGDSLMTYLAHWSWTSASSRQSTVRFGIEKPERKRDKELDRI